MKGIGFAWLDRRTYDNLMDANQYVERIEHRQWFKVTCLQQIAKLLMKNTYDKYLVSVLN